MNTEKLEPNQFQGVSAVRVIAWHSDRAADDEVNEALELGWKLLLVQPGPEHPIFVIGWSNRTEPTKTKRQLESERFAEAARRKMAAQASRQTYQAQAV